MVGEARKRLPPLAHCLLKGDDCRLRSLSLRQEVLKPGGLAAFLARNRLADGVGDGCGRALDMSLEMQRAVFLTKCQPRLHLIKAQAVFCLRDGFAADAGEDELVPELIGGCEFFGALTSLMAITMAQARAGVRLYAWS